MLDITCGGRYKIITILSAPAESQIIVASPLPDGTLLADSYDLMEPAGLALIESTLETAQYVVPLESIHGGIVLATANPLYVGFALAGEDPQYYFDVWRKEYEDARRPAP